MLKAAAADACSVVVVVVIWLIVCVFACLFSISPADRSPLLFPPFSFASTPQPFPFPHCTGTLCVCLMAHSLFLLGSFPVCVYVIQLADCITSRLWSVLSLLLPLLLLLLLFLIGLMCSSCSVLCFTFNLALFPLSLPSCVGRFSAL